jgi:hypothetical protein
MLMNNPQGDPVVACEEVLVAEGALLTEKWPKMMNYPRDRVIASKEAPERNLMVIVIGDI